MAGQKKEVASSAPPHGYHFGGPWGTAGVSTILPIVVYALAFACNDVSGCPAPSLLDPKNIDLAQLKREVGWPEQGVWGLGSINATLAVVGYFFFNALLYRFLPAQEVDGVVLATGGKLKYRFNSFASSMFIVAILAAGTALEGADWALWVYISDNYIQILTANMILAFVIATYVYIRSFSVKPGNKENRELAEGGHSGNLIYDWFIGRELNPRVTIPIIGEVDIKHWMEVRPGLLGWAILNLAWIAKQYRTFGFVSNSIVFISAIQFLYTVDCWWNEPAILTTIDITTDGFGFMLSFGDIAWLPFVYSMQTRYLSMYPVSLNAFQVTTIGATICLAYYIFRASNNQKKQSSGTNPNDPSVAHLKVH
ncbi:Delta(14)-sterol reductase [Verticillium alfalfae VaMs.102]|uniref:Delta(14)-sterol reductase n=1 Tax=Verticillium alfalfae (strain VaMs.102 / ATCC MYA-4576 / FGSC 10136) TaxID=526221 RepID=C9SDW0_VERA1|nr:Delta(14)-sterol reductase [Verticillium alfalfae VaMs.102]EEY16446.1 Delta(14)-sterol reductase [Verticillium alfalfae VaMs.102]